MQEWEGRWEERGAKRKQLIAARLAWERRARGGEERKRAVVPRGGEDTISPPLLFRARARARACVFVFIPRVGDLRLISAALVIDCRLLTAHGTVMTTRLAASAAFFKPDADSR